MSEDKPHQNLAIIGHVDHGKSTLLGDGPCLVQESPDQRALPVVYVADDGQVLVWLVLTHCISRAEALYRIRLAVSRKTISKGIRSKPGASGGLRADVTTSRARRNLHASLAPAEGTRRRPIPQRRLRAVGSRRLLGRPGHQADDVTRFMSHGTGSGGTVNDLGIDQREAPSVQFYLSR